MGEEGIGHMLVEKRRGSDKVECYSVGTKGECQILAQPENWRLEAGMTNIFIASSCSFLGMISSMCGASRGYVVVICVRIALCTEDLTLDLEPGEMLQITC